MFSFKKETTEAPSKTLDIPEELKGEGNLYATIKTSLGSLVVQLFDTKAPQTVSNFVRLATGTRVWTHPKTGAKMENTSLYAGTVFHRVIPNFMIQGGNPLGEGFGGPGYKFADEFHPELRHDRPGILSMANSGPGTNGSQFFITEVPTPHLNNRHSVFGAVVSNVELVKKIASVPRDQRDKPRTPVVLESISFVRAAQPPAL